MAEIKAGDIVQLKSDGPKMTVSKIWQGTDNIPMARCDWFSGTAQVYGSFPLTSLKLAQD
jgi:uncharacterized protein YodC (DUF2158 family)